jgi:hypothetical protein
MFNIAIRIILIGFIADTFQTDRLCSDRFHTDTFHTDMFCLGTNICIGTEHCSAKRMKENIGQVFFALSIFGVSALCKLTIRLACTSEY